jgi:hypothetical protein
MEVVTAGVNRVEITANKDDVPTVGTVVGDGIRHVGLLWICEATQVCESRAEEGSDGRLSEGEHRSTVSSGRVRVVCQEEG